MKKILLATILVIYMITIFYLSHQPGEVSQSNSDIVTDVVDAVTNDNVSFDFLSFIVRKSTHFILFGGLSVVIFLNLRLYNKKIIACMVLSVISTFIYACTDEFHQTLVSDRTGAFSDVLLDTSGAIIAMFIIYIVYIILRRFNVKKN